MARKPPPQPDVAPDGPDAGMVREGDPFGPPSVRFCPEKRQNYHLNRFGQREYHEVPAGYTLDDQGVPEPLPDAAPEVTPDADRS